MSAGSPDRGRGLLRGRREARPTRSSRADGARRGASGRDGRSSQWKSSTATRTGAAVASALEDVEDREPDCAWLHGTVAAGSVDHERRSERASAEFIQRRQHLGCPTGSAARRSLRKKGRLRPRPRGAQGPRVPPARASCSAACQSSVLPIPASPESTSTEGAASARARKSSSARSSFSRPLSR